MPCRRATKSRLFWPRAVLHLSPAATEDAIRLLDGRNPGSNRSRSLETFWTLERRRTEVLAREEFSGAGYGDRTRLAGLGSQSITTMLSPRRVRFRS